MEPTLKEGERVLMYSSANPDFYEVAVYNYPYPGKVLGEAVMISRVCGLPGDVVKIKYGLLYRNGQMSDSPGVFAPDENIYSAHSTPVFGWTPQNNWTPRNYGAVTIPAKGQKLTISKDNIHLYGEILQKFEGVPSSALENLPFQHTFTNDYYFMVSDNRGHAFDSRYFGFVPRHHLVGGLLF